MKQYNRVNGFHRLLAPFFRHPRPCAGDQSRHKAEDDEIVCPDLGSIGHPIACPMKQSALTLPMVAN